MTLAIVFPGQGSQSVGMMDGFAGDAAVEETFREARSIAGIDYLAHGPRRAGRGAQPDGEHAAPHARGGRGLLARVAREGRADARVVRGPQPRRILGARRRGGDALRGRAAAGALARAGDAGSGTRGHRRRSPPSSASTTGRLRAVCADAAEGEVVEPANLNSPGQVVIAGHRGRRGAGHGAREGEGRKRAVMLPMSAPSHCSLMTPAAERLRARLASIDVRKPADSGDAQSLRGALRRSGAHPGGARRAARPPGALDRDRAVPGRAGREPHRECGPGKVLTGLCKRIAAGAECIAIQDSGALDAAPFARLGPC